MKRLFMTFARVLIRLFAFLLLGFGSSLYILDKRPLADGWLAKQIGGLQISSPSVSSSFHSPDGFFGRTQVFKFYEVQFTNCPLFGVKSKDSAYSGS